MPLRHTERREGIEDAPSDHLNVESYSIRGIEKRIQNRNELCGRVTTVVKREGCERLYSLDIEAGVYEKRKEDVRESLSTRQTISLFARKKSCEGEAEGLRKSGHRRKPDLSRRGFE